MAKRGKKAHVSDDTFGELMKSAEQALAYERGQRGDYRVTRVISGHSNTKPCEEPSRGKPLRNGWGHENSSNK